ncbi:MAG: dimethyl sulfoxide reductase anchor subunit [Methylococcales bacterium]|nr:dimethyl sulfoxide reductase anchor subunit [Methylococcales bacterium]
MYKVREGEPSYAFLKDSESQEKSRYGQPIELTVEDSALRGESLTINGDGDIGENPNRYKQHGFYLNADNCIGCHACESACSEKNDVPSHIAFRSVGFVEGGTYPNYQRINISMACNHCEDPVCLKGCPTRAYTKFAEYGAVLQDPDICFGCGYCTWVCPYNAPQLDPVKGEVSKCNMCVDRLEVGLKPACVSACLGNALDFGVIENIPENREQAETEISGFPRADITRPNIRFQQNKPTEHEMTRTDSMPVKYHREHYGESFKATVDEKQGHEKYWNFKKLLTSHEIAHVVFTLCTQATMGAFILLLLGTLVGVESLALLKTPVVFPVLLAVLVIICTMGLYQLNMHLGKPHRFYRGFYNLKLSPVSREIAGVSLFYLGLLGYSSLALFEVAIFQWLAMVFAWLGVLGALVGGYFMYKLYRIPARPFWDHWQTGSAFVSAALIYGALVPLMVTVLVAPSWIAVQPVIAVLAWVMVAGLIIEGVGHVFHARDMKKWGNEGAGSYYWQVTKYGKSYWLRNGLLGLAMLLAAGLALIGIENGIGLVLLGVLTGMVLVTGAIGRSLFFVLVIPTTMPGAFFWKNDGFVEHARETGLAEMEQVGVAYERHHKFKTDELIATIKEHSLLAMVEEAKNILKG